MQSYSHTAKILHWLVAGLIVSQYLLAELGELAEDGGNKLNQLAILANHKSIGITILLLALVRLILRFRTPPPALPNSMPRWQHLASNASHTLLYVLLFALPVSGWLMSSAKAYTVSWFSLVSLPNLIAPSESWYDVMHETHEVLGTALLVLAAVHVAAALKHHFMDRDDVLKRMASVAGWWVLILSIIVGVGYFGRLFTSSVTTQPAPQSSQQGSTVPEAATPNTPTGTLPTWTIDYTNSHIKFTGDQAGAEFTGAWEQWRATIQFSKDALSESLFDVEIDPSSANSGDQERDETISSAEFFDASKFPTARFTANTFTETEVGFVTEGRLSMKGISKPIEFSFNVSQKGAQQRLSGSAVIDRLAWNIGTGDWQDTSWVGQDVTVNVVVVTTEESQP